MLVLFESPAGYSLFKVLDEGKLAKPESLNKAFEKSPNKLVNLQAFHKFSDTIEAVSAATAIVESKVDKSLKKFLKKNVKDTTDALAVIDPKLGAAIKEKLGIQCVNDSSVMELIRGIRNKLPELMPNVEEKSAKAMALGLSHNLSRYKLKFSPDKVDTMIVQAITLLDELDKEINTYAMRVREWYGWHFPEMARILSDNMNYAKVVLKAGLRPNFSTTDFSDILDEDIEKNLKETCEISMGTEISEEDITNVKSLAEQVLSMTQYRAQLFDYLKNRMAAIAPNLTVMVGELVGARLIAHAGSLMNLAKAPASTVQILGAEKALFRALKTKHETPKYGLIYHASLIGQSAPKNKGKISRVLAAKCALSIRVDALGDSEEPTIGLEMREKVEARLRQLETGESQSASKGSAKKIAAYTKSPSANGSYNDDGDVTMTTPSKNAAAADSSDEEKTAKKAKKDKKEKKKKDKKDLVDDVSASEKKSKKKRKREEDEETETPSKADKKKMKKEKKSKKEKA